MLPARPLRRCLLMTVSAAPGHRRRRRALITGTRVLSVSTLPSRSTHRRFPRARPLGALLALVGATVVLGGCTGQEPTAPLESLDAHDALVEEIAGALETEGIIEAGSVELGERGAQFEDGRCRVFARDADAITVETQPEAEAVLAAVDPALEGSGFAPLEESDVAGGHLRLSSTDERGAHLEITWKSSHLDVSIHGTADLPETECTAEAVG